MKQLTHRTVLGAAFVALLVAFFGAVYSLRNYFVYDQLVVPAAEMAVPLPTSETMRLLGAQFGTASNDAALLQIIRSRLDESSRLHRSWIDSLKLHRGHLRNQVVLWSGALAATFLLVSILLRNRHAL